MRLRFVPSVARLGAILLLLAAPTARATPGKGRGFELSKTPVWPKSADRIAILIGVDDYHDQQITPLKGAVKDARRLSAALIEHAGFSKDRVFLMTSDQKDENEPTRAKILGRLWSIQGYARQHPDVLVLFAFAGHGVERGNRAFLLPSDAQDRGVGLLEETAISIDRIKEWIKDTNARQAMFILDSCRTNPEKGRSGAVAMSKLMVDRMNLAIRNTGIDAFVTLYATAPGHRAYETAHGNGFFTTALVEGLAGAASRNGQVTLGSLIDYVRRTVPDQVMLAFGAEQKPYVDIRGYRADELVIAAKQSPPTIVLPPPSSLSPSTGPPYPAAETPAAYPVAGPPPGYPPPPAMSPEPAPADEMRVPASLGPKIEILESVSFRAASSEVPAASFLVLESVEHKLRTHADLMLEISGHTDDRESGLRRPELLAVRRAEAVKKHLTSRGIEAKRLTTVGHGANMPIAGNTTDTGRAANRRVEFRIISGGGRIQGFYIYKRPAQGRVLPPAPVP